MAALVASTVAYLWQMVSGSPGMPKAEAVTDNENTSQSKSLVNSPETMVDESIAGLVLASPHLSMVKGHRVIVRTDIAEYKQSHVALVSGGGSGHEPAHGGFVGTGMLSAAVCGDVFASPPPSAILAAIRSVAGPPGVLLIIKNYTGDRLNFGLAAEQAKVEGIKVEMIVVGDDCALPKSNNRTGRRGLAGTLFVHKAAGAAAAAGKSLEDVLAIAERVAANLGTIGISLSACVVPGRSASFTLPQDEAELGTTPLAVVVDLGPGLGIHGEQGFMRVSLSVLSSLVKQMLDTILSQDEKRSYIQADKNSPVAVLINNLGGTSVLELGVVFQEVLVQLQARGFKVVRAYSGTLMTSIAMAGVSITLLSPCDDEVVSALDYKVDAMAWPAHASLQAIPKSTTISVPETKATVDTMLASKSASKALALGIKTVLKAIASRLIKIEPEVTALDTVTGDGDCGTTMRSAGQLLLSCLDGDRLTLDKPAKLISQLATIIGENMGGSSGALYSIFLHAASRSMLEATPSDPVAWANAFEVGLAAIQKYGGAQQGDRTMLDALLPGCKAVKEALQNGTSVSAATALAAQAAMSGAKKTGQMSALAGRSSYIDPSRIQGTPDPGAIAAAHWLEAMADALAEK